MSWSERDRTVKITVLSQIEDLECGFSAEEGNFPYLPADLVGKAWPMIFGLVYDCPAVLKVDFGIQGVTARPRVHLDRRELRFMVMAYYRNPLTAVKLDTGPAMMAILRKVASMGCGLLDECREGQGDNAWTRRIRRIPDSCGRDAERTRSGVPTRSESQQSTCAIAARRPGDNPVQILGGEDFPQNQTITLNINGGLFTGYFQGQTFYIQGLRRSPGGPSVPGGTANRLADPCRDRRRAQ